MRKSRNQKSLIFLLGSNKNDKLLVFIYTVPGSSSPNRNGSEPIIWVKFPLYAHFYVSLVTCGARWTWLSFIQIYLLGARLLSRLFRFCSFLRWTFGEGVAEVTCAFCGLYPIDS